MIDKGLQRSKDIPNLGGVIIGRRKHRFTVWAEYGASHRRGMTFQNGNGRARYCIPNARRLIAGSRRNASTVGTEGGAEHGV
jgi:hypothetical protein